MVLTHAPGHRPESRQADWPSPGSCWRSPLDMMTQMMLG